MKGVLKMLAKILPTIFINTRVKQTVIGINTTVKRVDNVVASLNGENDWFLKMIKADKDDQQSCNMLRKDTQ